MATVVTPNQFELQYILSYFSNTCYLHVGILYCRVISGITVDSQASLIKAMHNLHDKGCNSVVVTSTTLAPSDEILYGYGSEMRSIWHKIIFCTKVFQK